MPKKRNIETADAASLVDDYVAEFERIAARGIPGSFKLAGFDAGKRILGCSDETQINVVHETMNRREHGYNRQQAVAWLKSSMLRRKLPYGVADIAKFAEALRVDCVAGYAPDTPLISQLERFTTHTPLPDHVVDLLRKAEFACRNCGSEFRKTVTRLRDLISDPKEVRLNAVDVWANAALADLQAMNDAERSHWNALLQHCQTAEGAKPSAKWKTSADELRQPIAADDFRSRVLAWLPLVARPAPNPSWEGAEWMMDSDNAAALKGLVWCCSGVNDPEIHRAITQLGITAYRKVPGVGPRAVALGNACVYALGQITGTDGVAQLAILKVRVKTRTAQNGIEKALTATAAREGVARDELEELCVPTYGLSDIGERTDELGDVRAEIVVSGRKVELRWRKSDGKQVKSVPAVVRAEYPDELKELRQAAKDIEKMIPAQATRIEQTYLQQKRWAFPVWCERYRDHPLVGSIARALIWSFSSGSKHGSAIYHDGRFLDAAGESADWIDQTAQVSLWHPIDAASGDITAWRDCLLEREIRQPFKQAHREIYLLTDAERNTRLYSNRFAAHVLKQHQFNALCTARGWKNTLRLLVDDEFPPAHIELPQFGLRAEYWVEGAGEDHGEDTNAAGTYFYLVTDQVRFYRSNAALNWAHASGGGYRAGQYRDADEPLPVADVPPLAFSEVMRDVDLFVGVASVGNDPNWSDGGPQGRYLDYWQDYSFGELGATAQTRKAVLERLIPRLSIADRCSFADRFLFVRGDLRTYKIHLGSGNILMEPNDQYLCIVARQSPKASDRVFLPFEGDNTMSIILSKAIMLADDRKIKDATITSQIGQS